MTLQELFEKTEAELKEKSILFSSFLRELCQEIGLDNKLADWQTTHVLDTEELLALWDYSLSILFDLAVSFADATDDPVYQEATEIATALRKVLCDNFGFAIEEVTIQSPSKIMEATGMVEIAYGPDGQPYIQLTGKMQDAVKKVEDMISDMADVQRNQ